MQLYHERFGHQDKRHVKMLLEREMNIKIPAVKEICEPCIFGKAHRKPFGSRKKATSDKGICTDNPEAHTLHGMPVDAMDPTATYKYLGLYQNITLDHSQIRKQLIQKYQQRVSAILKSHLHAKNMFQALNTYAIPLLSYSFGVIKWPDTDLQAANRLARTQLTKYRKMHPKSCKERVNLKREDGGRGLRDVGDLNHSQVVRLRKYFRDKNHPLHRAVVKADRGYTPLNLATCHEPENMYTAELKREQWVSKPLHGKHPANVDKPGIDKQLSYSWLKQGNLFPETEGFCLAIQDQVTATRNYQKFIIKDDTIESDSCRKCHLARETIEHITGGCRLLAATEYTERHNTVAKVIHLQIAKKYHLPVEEVPYFKYNPQSVQENAERKLYWDRAILTDHTVPANRPDITLIHKVSKQTFLIDVAIPNDANVTEKYQEKIGKYTPLATEIKEIWEQRKVVIVPIVLSATGITPTSFISGLKTLEIPLKVHAECQKAVILKTCNIVRMFLNG